MKFNKQLYRETFSKVEISQEMKEKLMKIPYNNVKKPFKRATASLVAAAIIVLSGVSVFAGVSLYNFYIQQEGPYSEGLILEKNKNADTIALSGKDNIKQPEYVKIQLNYLPDEFTKAEKSTDIYTYEYKEDTASFSDISLAYDYKGNTGLYFDIIDVSDEEKLTINNDYILNSNLTTLNGNSVYYLEKQVLNPDEDIFDKEIYMYFSDYDYLVKCDAGFTVTKNMLYKIFENLSLDECNKIQAHSISKWADISYDVTLYGNNDKEDYYVNNNYYIKVGETQKINDIEFNVDVTVDSIVISDDLSMMNDAFKSEFLDDKGKIKPLEVKCYSGDGKDSLLKLSDTKHIPLKYVYETVTYRNQSDKDIKDFCVYHQIVSPPDNIYVTYDVFNNLEKDYESVEYDENFDYRIGEWVYDSFSKSETNSPNYIDIPANDEVTVNIGFFIPEETLSKDLWIDIYQGYSVNGGFGAEKAVLVDIPQ